MDIDTLLDGLSKEEIETAPQNGGKPSNSGADERVKENT
jgi:hypothetical protein